METRILVVRRMCPHCRQMMRVINKLNLRLPIDKRLEIIDAYEYEEFNLQSLPLLKKLEEDGLKYGYPFLYLNGTICEPSATPEQLFIFLTTFLKDEFIIN